MTGNNRKILAAVVAIASLFFGTRFFGYSNYSAEIIEDRTIEKLYANRQSGEMVEFEGKIIKQLSDDNDGSRHQRFIVQLDSQQTVLIAHNIDLAPRVPIGVNKNIRIYGQYEWNEKGGVIHWTHADPAGDYEAGWIKYQGKVYQ